MNQKHQNSVKTLREDTKKENAAYSALVQTQSPEVAHIRIHCSLFTLIYSMKAMTQLLQTYAEERNLHVIPSGDRYIQVRLDANADSSMDTTDDENRTRIVNLAELTGS